MASACLLTVLLQIASLSFRHSARAQQQCADSPVSRRTAGGSVFTEAWPQDEDDPFSATCCGDLFHCAERRATCLQCDDTRCDPVTVSLPGCPDDNCQVFGLLCDQRSDCPDGADESHCGDIVRSFRSVSGQSITASELALYGVSLETCAAYCFFHPDRCQVFSYSNTTVFRRFEGVTQRHQITSGRPLYNSQCLIGCQACGLAARPQPGFTLYQSTLGSARLRVQLQNTRDEGDPARDLLPRHPICGRRDIETSDVTLLDRVAGGHTVLYGEFPWQVQIRSFDFEVGAWVHTCGGVIISDRFVLTAAHCMRKALGQYEVIVGQYDLQVKESFEREFGIKGKLDVPDYLANGTKVGDLAVLLLDLSNRPAISFSSKVRPACLIRPEDPAPGSSTRCVVSGWGSTLPGARQTPHRLHGADIPIISDAFCSTEEVYGALFVPDKMVCAGSVAGGVDTCQGDSGGGLVCLAQDGSWQVVGVVATGNDVCGAVGKPGIYTELQPYYDKIVDILQALS